MQHALKSSHAPCSRGTDHDHDCGRGPGPRALGMKRLAASPRCGASEALHQYTTASRTTCDGRCRARCRATLGWPPSPSHDAWRHKQSAPLRQHGRILPRGREELETCHGRLCTTGPPRIDACPAVRWAAQLPYRTTTRVSTGRSAMLEPFTYKKRCVDVDEL